MQTINEIAKKVHEQRPHLLLGSQAFTAAVVEEYTKELNDNFKELEAILAEKTEALENSENGMLNLIKYKNQLEEQLAAKEKEWISAEDTLTPQQEEKIKIKAKETVDKFIKSFGENPEEYNGVFYNKKQSIGINVVAYLEDLAFEILSDQSLKRKK